ncbi:carbamoyl-phosphate synthase large subunit [Cohnella endophytica]|uniref:Carbamoyl-phosphate synthase large subunit n=1 Tax=Cohnella endophytica TaxID=2419778 RepID=A0A494XG55_9BACL|nr:ATP-grasp domain-containing protein [Cohnella endophytica]RKP48832.1 carbamoyl-phosphate synthase large subunit [Cohnella endophytica]
MTNIYFNRWFSVAYHYMNMIRDNPDGESFRFYGTHPDVNHLSLQACDHAEQEPSLQGGEYVDYALDFCRRNEIDVFIPRLKMLEIAKEIGRFDAIGTKVMVCRDVELLESMMEKELFYERLQGSDVVPIPEYETAETPEQFRSGYEKLAEQGHRVCFKPTNAEGGMGFRIIDNDLDPLAGLYGYVSSSISFEQAYDALSRVERFPKLMVMELLEDEEYSIDCLADSAGGLLTAIPRRKAAGRVYTLDAVPELLEIARGIADKFRIPYVYNIQVKYNKGVPKLLEINPRMSGGLYITCLSGVNMPYLAVQEILGKRTDTPVPRYGVRASYIEHPIVLADLR